MQRTKVNKDPSLILTSDTAPKCACGCGGNVKLSYAKKYEKSHWNKFIHGHHAKMRKGWHHSEEFKKYLSELKKGKPGPNKGIPMKESTKQLLSKIRKGRKLTEEHKEKIRKTTKETYANPEIRKKCGHFQIISEEHKEKVRQFMLNAWQDSTFRENLIGEKSNNWRGGITFEPYGMEFNKMLKKQIYERDNYTCQNPKCVAPGKRLNTHHIDYNKQNNIESNLITLCCKCHCITNWNREYWMIFYQKYN